MKKVMVFLAEGFEEIEAVTPIDLLRRAGVDCETVSIMGERNVKGARGVTYQADTLFDKEKCEKAEAIILPGGMPGTKNLMNHTQLAELLKEFDKKQKWIAAICAAPMILGHLGLLEGKKATIYPGMEEELKGAVPVTDEVCQQGHIITSRGAGTAIPFALCLIQNLIDEKTAKQIGDSIVYRQ